MTIWFFASMKRGVGKDPVFKDIEGFQALG